MCSEEAEAGGVGKYSVVAVRKVEPLFTSNEGVSGALVRSIQPLFQFLCWATLMSICSWI